MVSWLCVQAKPSFLSNLAVNDKLFENEKQKNLKVEADVIEGTHGKQLRYCCTGIFNPEASGPVHMQTRISHGISSKR